MQRKRTWSRRDVMRHGAALSLSTSGLTIIGRRAAAQSGKLTVMAVGGSWGDAIKEYIGQPFTQGTKAEVAYDQRPNAQQVAALQAMRGNPTIGTVELGGPRLGQVIAMGLIDPIDPAKVPSYADVHSGYKNPYYADRYVAPWVLTFNHKQVDKAKAAAEGWRLLLDPKLKGRVAIPKFGWMGEMWMNAANLTLGGSYDNFDAAVDLSRKIVRENGGLVMESNDQGMKLFSTGEIWAAPFWSGRTYQMADSGTTVDFVYPKGWVPYGSGFVLVKGSREKALAEKFIDISLSPDVQAAIARKFAYLPTNTKAMAAVDSIERLRIAPDDMAKVLNLEYDRIYKFSDKHLERFNREVVG